MNIEAGYTMQAMPLTSAASKIFLKGVLPFTLIVIAAEQRCDILRVHKQGIG